ncbi:MAG: dienelactone hydrolase family protein [Deltaproteobacteria bacterium]|nr:dienelactone hydrolase family protein [Deltaproteobacteria bacterium]MBW2416470.1 dienelactone hydrolase family protein [Deltaproteobacteria bacterium]
MTLTGQTFRTSDGTDVAIYRSAPADDAPHPGLIIFPSIFGVTVELRQHADEIAATGAVVLAFDPFARCEDSGPVEEDGRERAFARMGTIDLAAVTRDFRELIAALKADPACNGRVVGLGICLGGPFCFNAAADGELDGVATWHGSRMGNVIGRASEVKCPVLMDYGDVDPIAPMEEIAKVESACSVIDDFRIRVHPGAGHGFSHTGWSDHHPEAMAMARPDLEKMLEALR